MSDYPPPPPPPSPPQPEPVAHQAPRNGVGTTALILGIIGVLAGIIPLFFGSPGFSGSSGWSSASLVVAASSGVRPPTGRWHCGESSPAPLVLSGVGLLILVGVFADQSEEASVDTESTVSPAAETSSPAPGGHVANRAEDIYGRPRGWRLGESPTVEETFSVETVPCSEPHSHEVFAS